MAVSLVSTGVQFPDSTIQTTAATAGSMTLVSTATSTSGTTVSFTGLTTTYKKYLIVYNGLRNSATGTTNNGRLRLRFSTNNGSSYLTTSQYSYVASYFDNTPNSPGINVAYASGDDGIDVYAKSNSATQSFASGSVTLYNPALNPSYPTVKFESTYVWIPQSGYGNPQSGGALGGAGWNYANGAHPFTTTGVNAVQFSWYGGETFTAGTWALYGVNQ